MILLNSVYSLACMITLLDRVYFFLCIILQVFIFPSQELLLYHTDIFLFDVNYYLRQI
jgi:hypothetical protein